MLLTDPASFSEKNYSNPPPEVMMLARSDKWIIPRNFVIDTLIACQPFGREMPLRFATSSDVRGRIVNVFL